MHGAGQGSNEHSGEAGRSRNNDWMTHHLSQQQPLAQWIQDRQKAFAEFSHSLISPDTYYLEQPDYWIAEPKKSNNKMLASNTAELSPKAKVSYDEGQFVVEIPLKDYRVSKYLYLGVPGVHLMGS